ncbi:MAG: hypothetical protein AB7J35_20260 [Dehalococcoidia bacterium]
MLRNLNRTGLFAGTAIASVVLGVGAVVYLAADGGGDKQASTTTLAATPTLTPMSTRIFDRRGPDGGVLLGELVRQPDPGTPPTPYSIPANTEAFVNDQVEPRLVRMCEAGWLPHNPGADCVESVHTSGYEVTTTLDWELNEAALKQVQDAIREGEINGCDCHNAALITIEPESGQVLIYVPNANPATREDPRVFGQIDQLVEVNLAGTAFLPVVYLTWFDKLAKTPLSTLWDTNPLPLDGGQVENAHAQVDTFGLISARAALAAALEAPGVQAAADVGVDSVLDTANALGITTMAQHFDPTWVTHEAVRYGPAVAAYGANVRAVDLAYMYATIANMGKMVGTPHLARSIDPASLPSTTTATGADYETALKQRLEFSRGDTRLPGTRELDPIVVLEVRDRNGKVLFHQGEPESRQVASPDSVWLLHSILSDCSARFIFWPCGRSNGDAALDFFTSDGTRVPSGIAFGQQPSQGGQILDMWFAGYARNAATVVWLGNADNSAIDTATSGALSSRVAVILWKTWMGAYHDALAVKGIDVVPSFDDLKPANVERREFTPAVIDVLRDGGGPAAFCVSPGNTWVRTDLRYESECVNTEFDSRTGLPATADTQAEYRVERLAVKLPALATDIAESIAVRLGIPVASP